MDITGNAFLALFVPFFSLIDAFKKQADDSCTPNPDEYDTQVYQLEQRPDEDNLRVEFKVKKSVRRDCNALMLWTTLQKTEDGHYVIKEPSGLSSAAACEYRYTELFDVRVKDAVIDYDSHAPIVIHAAKGLMVSYEVQTKSVTIASSSTPGERTFVPEVDNGFKFASSPE
ncbi:ecotin family protein [Pseudomonas pergaminensis]|uniref:Ecotin family protein n=1 Tax=Pseudomonas pergaminensis TaxID=2853159 RepID=A0ABW8R1I9_9PSED|nr:ecotin family protein [Pseudomonas sp.]